MGVFAETETTRCGPMKNQGLERLQGHAMDCPSGKALTGFQLAQSECGGDDMAFKYSCAAGNVLKEDVRHTACGPAVNHDVHFFDRYEVTCNQDEVLTKWKLTGDGCNSPDNRVEYHCGRVPVQLGGPVTLFGGCQRVAEQRLQAFPSLEECPPGLLLQSFKLTGYGCDEPVVEYRVDIGDGDVKTVDVGMPLICPKWVDRTNWLNTEMVPDHFRITVDGNKVTATRKDSDEGWGMKLAFHCISADTPEPAAKKWLANKEGQTYIEEYTINVGNTGRGPKTITVDKPDLFCPGRVDRSNWLNGDTYGDWFEVTVKGNQVTVARGDTGNEEDGWGMQLAFKCTNSEDSVVEEVDAQENAKAVAAASDHSFESAPKSAPEWDDYGKVVCEMPSDEQDGVGDGTSVLFQLGGHATLDDCKAKCLAEEPFRCWGVQFNRNKQGLCDIFTAKFRKTVKNGDSYCSANKDMWEYFEQDTVYSSEDIEEHSSGPQSSATSNAASSSGLPIRALAVTAAVCLAAATAMVAKFGRSQQPRQLYVFFLLIVMRFIHLFTLLDLSIVLVDNRAHFVAYYEEEEC
ncbi:hypothetical protein CYMTET_10212 [Cymbomonas tetramitiformis]|uniref:Apple domain-containing protein n=1 Tax=Cymbomonas tetramitiformis TaxID=36881 RepID=A0AAE0GR65_9CHLO|nr:hypothetical protein CYMTET_10212 [Cymbomonas tetramitiformis]